jgi:hypothetical protein
MLDSAILKMPSAQPLHVDLSCWNNSTTDDSAAEILNLEGVFACLHISISLESWGLMPAKSSPSEHRCLDDGEFSPVVCLAWF